MKNTKKIENNRTAYKVRIAKIYSAYFFVEAKDEEEAYKLAEEHYKNPEECDMVNEASHINHTIEVEEAE